jgi:hypothetical protein
LSHSLDARRSDIAVTPQNSAATLCRSQPCAGAAGLFFEILPGI